MKNKKIISRAISLVIASLFCLAISAQITPAGKKYTIVDLNTGDKIDVYYDTVSWRTINKTSNSTVDYYVIVYDNAQRDTVHGITGIIVNNMIWKNPEGMWVFNEEKVKWDGNEMKMKDAYGRKVKWEKGELKVKDWNSKYKKEDDTKYKEEWDKIKWKDDEMKIEKGTQKTKTKEGG